MSITWGDNALRITVVKPLEFLLKNSYFIPAGYHTNYKERPIDEFQNKSIPCYLISGKWDLFVESQSAWTSNWQMR